MSTGTAAPRTDRVVLAIEGLSKTYGSGTGRTVAISQLDFAVHHQEFVSVVGPSGCGKTTLLKCIGGLIPPSTGRTLLDGREVTRPPESLAIVFQDYARSLYPWMTVRENVLLPLRRKRKAGEREPIADNAISAVGLGAFADHYPWQLSGGMQQRVAIARGLAYQPEVLLLDEPFASVDAQTRAELEDLLLTLKDQFGITCLLVTHDIDEAVYMSDRVVMLTRHPAEIQGIVVTDLPNPRHQVSTKELAAFANARRIVYTSITHEQGRD